MRLYLSPHTLSFSFSLKMKNLTTVLGVLDSWLARLPSDPSVCYQDDAHPLSSAVTVFNMHFCLTFVKRPELPTRPGSASQPQSSLTHTNFAHQPSPEKCLILILEMRNQIQLLGGGEWALESRSLTSSPVLSTLHTPPVYTCSLMCCFLYSMEFMAWLQSTSPCSILQEYKCELNRCGHPPHGT